MDWLRWRFVDIEFENREVAENLSGLRHERLSLAELIIVTSAGALLFATIRFAVRNETTLYDHKSVMATLVGVAYFSATMTLLSVLVMRLAGRGWKRALVVGPVLLCLIATIPQLGWFADRYWETLSAGKVSNGFLEEFLRSSLSIGLVLAFLVGVFTGVSNYVGLRFRFDETKVESRWLDLLTVRRVSVILISLLLVATLANAFWPTSLTVSNRVVWTQSGWPLISEWTNHESGNRNTYVFNAVFNGLLATSVSLFLGIAFPLAVHKIVRFKTWRSDVSRLRRYSALLCFILMAATPVLLAFALTRRTEFLTETGRDIDQLVNPRSYYRPSSHFEVLDLEVGFVDRPLLDRLAVIYHHYSNHHGTLKSKETVIVSIEVTTLDTPELDRICDFRWLRRIQIADSVVTKSNLENLVSRPTLQGIVFDHTELPVAWERLLNRSMSLTELRLPESYPVSAELLEKLDRLKSLTAQVVDPAVLPNLPPSIESLNLTIGDLETDLVLNDLYALQQLSITLEEPRHFSVIISNSPSLSDLRFEASPTLSSSCPTVLLDLRKAASSIDLNLRNIQLGRVDLSIPTPRIALGVVDDGSDAELLAVMVQRFPAGSLVSLDAQINNYNPSLLSALTQQSSLVQLAVSGNPTDPREAENFRRLPKILQRIDLPGLSISNDDFRDVFREFLRLESIVVGGQHITELDLRDAARLDLIRLTKSPGIERVQLGTRIHR